MAWARKILRINLTSGTVKSEPLNMEWAQKYLGQRGLASKYLIEEIDPKCDPLGPGNKIIYATGPANRYGRFDWWPLFGRHQGAADQRHRLLELGRLLRRRIEVRRLGHAHP